MSSIRLHPKHGLNPTVPTCFWCGNDKNEVVLLGAAYKGEAPMHMCMDYEPCDTCKSGMESGVTLIEATDKPVQKVPEIQQGVYPTGRWWVITHDAAERLFNVPVQTKAFIEVGVAEQIGLVATLEA